MTYSAKLLMRHPGWSRIPNKGVPVGSL